MTIFCHRCVSSTFTPYTPSSLSFTIHFSTSSSFTPFVTRSQLFSLSPPHPLSAPSQCQALHTHTLSNAVATTHTYTHTLTLRTALLSPSKLVPLSLTRSASRIFQWWLLSLSSPRKQRIFVHTGQRKGEGWKAGQGGRDPTLECGHRINGKKSIYKRGNPSVLVSASIVLVLAFKIFVQIYLLG